VPAALGVTAETFIVYSSNIFAVMGLRALYFVLVGGLASLRFLKPALVIVLVFIGLKMVLGGPPVLGLPMPILKVPTLWSLLIVATILGSAVVASFLYERHRRGQARVEELGRRIAAEAESSPNGAENAVMPGPGPAGAPVPPKQSGELSSQRDAPATTAPDSPK